MAPKIVNREEKQRQILGAAMSVFARYGYQRASIEQIAEAAGIAKGSLYQYFKNKEELFFMLFEFSAEQAMQAVIELEQNNDRHAVLIVEDILLAIALSWEEDENLIPLTLEFWSVCGVEQTRQRFTERFQVMYQEMRKHIVGILKHGRAKGEVHADAPLTDVTSCLLGLLDGLLVQQWVDPKIKMSRVLKKALPVLMRALRG